MLTIPTPELIRDHVAEAYNQRHGRKPGAVGLVVNGIKVRDYVHSTLTEHECESPEDLRHCSSVRAEDLLLLRSPIGELALIGHEGVGDAVDEAVGTIPAYVAIGWAWEPVELPHAIVQDAFTGEGVDVADWVRLFGDRLDGNAYIWRRFCGVA